MNKLSTVLVFLIVLFSIPTVVTAQTYNMTDGETTTTCGGTFYDTGGPNGDYENNEDIVHTFCADDPNLCLRFDFESVGFSVLDNLSVYDGASTNGTYLGEASEGRAFVSPSNCLTFEFSSNFIFTAPGWEAAISCVTCPLPPNQSQQDCGGAIPVCQSTYFQPFSYTGTGTDADIPAFYSCLESGERNSVWYVINVQETGDLSFLIKPVDSCDDYDWGVWDITDLDACDQIDDNTNTLLSCNYANSSTFFGGCPLIDDGLTGPSSANGGTTNSEDPGGNPYNADIPVQAGRTYMVLVNNFSETQGGYSLDFTPSTAVIFDDTPPEIQQILNTPLACGETEINIEFSEPIVCSSIQPEDFQVTQPDGTQLNVLALETSTCNDEDFIKTITIVTAPLTQGGIHTFDIVGELEDNCGNILTDASIDFLVETIDVDAGEDITFCNGETPNALGGNPTSAAANQYTWTSDPSSGTSFISATDVANPTIVNPQNMPAGTYNFYVEAALGSCTAVDTIIVTVEEFSISNISSPTAAMCNEANGEAVVELLGGVAPFDYNWEDAANVGVTVSTDSLAMGLSPGVYNVTVTDSGGCEATGSVSVSNLPGPTLSSPDSVPATCDASDGQASVVANGGTPPYIFSWEDEDSGTIVSTDSLATGLSEGNYTVTVTNKDGSCPITLSLMVNEDVSTCCNITVDNTEVEHATCGMDNGTVTLMLGNLNVSSIEWQDVLNPGAVVATGNVASNLPAGTYSYTITDNNDCEYTDEVTINGSTNPVISMPMAVNSTCGDPNGTASFSVNGGTYPYSYNWEDATNNGTTISTDSLATGLVGGTTYNVTVTDDADCIAVGMINLTNTPGPEIIDVEEISANCGSEDGTASVDINAGAGEQTFVWEDAMGNQVSTMQVATGLSSGAYTVTVTDENGCTDTETANINDADGPMISNPIVTSTQCGSSNGTANVTVTGGAWEYSFSWENSMGVQVSTDSVATGLTADTYTVTVIDKNNCSDNETIMIVDTPGPTLGNLEESAPPCPGDDGMAVITLSGGTPPYSLEMDLATFTSPVEITAPPGNYSVTFTDANNCPITVDYIIPSAEATIINTSPTATSCGEDNGSITINVAAGLEPPYQYSLDGVTFQTDNVFNDLPAGEYFVTVQGDMCLTSSVVPTVVLSSTPLSIMINEKNATCGDADGEATVDVIQGMGTDYTWEDAANPGTVISTDATITGLSSGTYNVTVTDGTCMVTGAANISDEGGPVIGDDPIVLDANCGDMDGSIEISVTGGMPSYTIEWEDADNPGVVIGSDNVITGLSGGTYNVVVTDANNCSASRSIIVNEPGNPVISVNKNDPFCDNNDGFIEIMVTEGAPGYIYEWENAEEPGVTISISNILNDLSHGTYHVTVTDNVGCIAMETITLDSMEVPVIWGTNVVSNATCGQEDGSAFVGVNGVEPLSYQWENTAYPGDIVGSTETATGLAAGNYVIVVTDANGCTASASVPIGDEGGPEIRVEDIDATCGQANGSAVVIVDSGTPDFTYNWENILDMGTSISTNDTINNLAEGDYNVTVTDGNGCSTFANVTIESTEGITFNMPSIMDPSCAGADGTITVNPVGGSSYYTYQWSNGNDQQVGVNLTAGTYTITVSDNAGCSGTTEVVLMGADAILFDVNTTDAGCSGSSDGSITIENVSGGGGAPYTYSVDGFSFTSETIFEDLNPGIYDVIVQDADNCQSIISIEIGAASVLEMDYGDDEEIELGESVDLFPTTNFPLDTNIYKWRWSEDSTLIFNDFSYNPTAQPTTTTTYIVTVTDSVGCSITDMITIRINQNREVYIPNAFSPNFDGQNDVFMVYGGIGVAQVRTMQIYDRWGDMIFEGNNFSTDNPAFGWDGRYRDSSLNPGVYVYYIEIDFTDGTSGSYRGDVTLVK